MLGSGAKVRVRGGKPADAKALANVFKESWLFAYRGIIPQRHLDSMVRQRTPDWWRDAMKTGDSTLVLDVGGAVAGYATLGNSRQRGRYQGEIYELYLDPLYQGLGLGEHLFEGCRHALDMRQARRPDRLGAARQHQRLRLLLAPRRASGGEHLHPHRRRAAGKGGLRLELTGRASRLTWGSCPVAPMVLRLAGGNRSCAPLRRRCGARARWRRRWPAHRCRRRGRFPAASPWTPPARRPCGRRCEVWIAHDGGVGDAGRSPRRSKRHSMVARCAAVFEDRVERPQRLRGGAALLGILADAHELPQIALGDVDRVARQALAAPAPRRRGGA